MNERGFAVLMHEAQGRIHGYLAPGKVGHGVAETEAVALALISQISLHAGPGWDIFFCPLRNTSLYRAALKSGCRLSKIMTLMTLGRTESRPGWMPSIAYLAEAPGAWHTQVAYSARLNSPRVTQHIFTFHVSSPSHYPA